MACQLARLVCIYSRVLHSALLPQARSTAPGHPAVRLRVAVGIPLVELVAPDAVSLGGVGCGDGLTSSGVHPMRNGLQVLWIDAIPDTAQVVDGVTFGDLLAGQGEE